MPGCCAGQYTAGTSCVTAEPNRAVFRNTKGRLERFMSNLKLGFRRLAKTPFVTLVAVLSLGLGIGANAAIFSLFNQVLLKRLPVQNPNELVNLSAPGPNPGSQSCGQAGPCSAVSLFLSRSLTGAPRSNSIFTAWADSSGSPGLSP